MKFGYTIIYRSDVFEFNAKPLEQDTLLAQIGR